MREKWLSDDFEANKFDSIMYVETEDEIDAAIDAAREAK